MEAEELGVGTWDQSWKQIINDGVLKWKAEEQDLAHEANYALIQEHWRITGSERVLIPLSGDSPVVDTFMAAGHSVVCVEFVPVAVQRLLARFPTLVVTKEERDGLVMHHCATQEGLERLTVMQGDVFRCGEVLEAHSFDIVYDRASLTAIHPTRRVEYVDTLVRLLKRSAGAGSRPLYFLDCVDRSSGPAEHLQDGPPYTTSMEEVARLYTGSDRPLELVFTGPVRAMEKWSKRIFFFSHKSEVTQ